MADKMSYRSAQVIGRRSLSDMITQNLSDPNKSTIGSFTGAISDKLKAKVTRFKERFDPMNIARVLGDFDLLEKNCQMVGFVSLLLLLLAFNILQPVQVFIAQRYLILDEFY